MVHIGVSTVTVGRSSRRLPKSSREFGHSTSVRTSFTALINKEIEKLRIDIWISTVHDRMTPLTTVDWLISADQRRSRRRIR